MIYRGKNCMKNFCESLREQAMKIINLTMKKKKFIKNRAAGIIQKCRILLYVQRKFQK